MSRDEVVCKRGTAGGRLTAELMQNGRRRKCVKAMRCNACLGAWYSSPPSSLLPSQAHAEPPEP